METIEIQRFKHYKARVSVKDRSTLKPDCMLVDGDEFVTHAMWIIEDGRYQGQWAMKAPDSSNYAWMPYEDLDIIEPA